MMTIMISGSNLVASSKTQVNLPSLNTRAHAT